MKNIKSNKGITNMTLITIVLVIIILMLLVAVIYLVKNPNTTYITQNLPNEQSQLSSTVIENENKYEKIKGTYEYSTESYQGYEGIYIGYRLSLKADGTYDYNITVDNNGGFCGNYIINGSEIILNKLFGYGSDIGITSIKEEQIILKINDDGTISDANKHEYVGSPLTKVVLTRKTTEIKETLKQYLDNSIKYYDETISKMHVAENKNNKISSDKFFEDMEEAYISKSLNLLSNNKSYSVNYVLKGKDSGKIIIKEDNKIINEQKLDKEIVDMYSVYENVYLLLEDGTIGQISLEENDYKLKVIEGYNNIVRIQEVVVGNDEGDGIILAYNLVAIDTNGEVKYITVTAD